MKKEKEKEEEKKSLAQLMREHNRALLMADARKGEEIDGKYKEKYPKSCLKGRFIFRMHNHLR